MVLDTEIHAVAVALVDDFVHELFEVLSKEEKSSATSQIPI